MLRSYTQANFVPCSSNKISSPELGASLCGYFMAFYIHSICEQAYRIYVVYNKEGLEFFLVDALFGYLFYYISGTVSA